MEGLVGGIIEEVGLRGSLESVFGRVRGFWGLVGKSLHSSYFL